MKEQITSKYTPWKVGDKVWLETTNLHMNGPKKLQMRRTGPFEVEEVISRTAFCLHIHPQWKIHPVAHAPPAMVLFFLFLFLPLTFAFGLTAVAVLYKPGCAVSAADTSSV